MSKTTTKKTKKSPTRTKKTVSAKKKTVTKKAAVRRKKPTRKVVKTTKKDLTPVMTVSIIDSAKKFFSVQKNVIMVVAILLFLGVGYLLKDVFIVAMVNGKPIYRWSVIQRLEEQGGRQILDSLITENLVKQSIKQAGVVVEQEEIDAAVKEIEDRIAAQGMTLEQALEEQGMTRDLLVEDIVMQKSAEMIVADRIEITDAEIDAYMEENSEFFPEGSDLDSLRDVVKEQLISAKITEEIQLWVQEIQDDAKIIYMKEYETAL
jgi:hypothetical protein